MNHISYSTFLIVSMPKIVYQCRYSSPHLSPLFISSSLSSSFYLCVLLSPCHFIALNLEYTDILFVPLAISLNPSPITLVFFSLSQKLLHLYHFSLIVSLLVTHFYLLVSLLVTHFSLLVSLLVTLALNLPIYSLFH